MVLTKKKRVNGIRKGGSSKLKIYLIHQYSHPTFTLAVHKILDSSINPITTNKYSPLIEIISFFIFKSVLKHVHIQKWKMLYSEQPKKFSIGL